MAVTGIYRTWMLRQGDRLKKITCRDGIRFGNDIILFLTLETVKKARKPRIS